MYVSNNILEVTVFKALYKIHSKTKWHSSSIAFQKVHFRLFTCVLLGFVRRQVSIWNQWEATRILKRQIRNIGMLKIFKYDWKLWFIMCLFNEALLDSFNLPDEFCKNWSFKLPFKVSRKSFLSPKVKKKKEKQTTKHQTNQECRISL